MVYDRDKSITYNLFVLNDSDFEISRASLYRYCQARNITTNTDKTKRYNIFLSFHNTDLSIRQELRMLAGCGLDISQKTLQNYRKRYTEEMQSFIILNEK